MRGLSQIASVNGTYYSEEPVFLKYFGILLRYSHVKLPLLYIILIYSWYPNER